MAEVGLKTLLHGSGSIFRFGNQGVLVRGTCSKAVSSVYGAGFDSGPSQVLDIFRFSAELASGGGTGGNSMYRKAGQHAITCPRTSDINSPETRTKLQSPTRAPFGLVYARPWDHGPSILPTPGCVILWAHAWDQTFCAQPLLIVLRVPLLASPDLLSIAFL